MSDAPKKTDPDNVFITPGVKDTTKAYIFVPNTYREAREAIKAEGGKWAGSQWEMDAEKLKGAEEAIRLAARADIALGVEGRKAREDALKAAQPEKAAKEPEVVKTPEEIEAAKEARAVAGRERALEADKTRVPVLTGSVAEGGTVTVGGVDVTVTKVGAPVDLTEESAARYAERFPDLAFKGGDSVSFAYFEAPVAELAIPEEDASPSM